MKIKFIKRIAAAGMAVACMVATTISAFALEGRSIGMKMDIVWI